MTPTSLAALVRHLRKITNPSAHASVSDAELLERFVHQRDEAAFELLVWRHQRLVLGVCRRVLGNVHDAGDAFQATFLALARKAATVGRGDALTSWLHTVAFRIALRARAATQRLKTNVDLAAVASRGDPTEEAERRDVATVLDEEISRLPRKYRVPVVLCYLEGKSYAVAAEQLGVAAGTLAGRLMRARELLRKRLLRRGIGVSGAVLAAVLGEQASLAAASAALVNTTVKAAASLLLGEPAAVGALSTTVTALTEAALRSMVVSKLKCGLVTLLAALVVAGMGLLVSAALVSPAIVTENPDPAGPSSESKAKSVRVDDFGDPLPDGAFRRLGTLRFRHGGGIEILLPTPDGKNLVSRDYYGTRTVCVWEMATGKLLHRLPGTYDQKNIALSPDGKLVAVGQRKVIVLWDLASGKEVRRLAQTDTFGFAFSRDGKLLAAGDVGPCVHLWDLATGKKIAQLKGKRDPIRVDLLALTPDGKTLIGGERWDSKIGLWDVASGEKRRELDGESGDIFTIALSPDGNLLATGSRKDGIPLWNVKTGELVRKLGKEGRRECYNVAFSPNGKTLAAIERDVNNQDSLSLWDVAAGKELNRFESDRGLWSLAYSHDGKTLIVASVGAIRLLDATTGKETGPTAGSPSFVRFATMSPDGRALAYLRNHDIRFWDMKAGRESGSINVHPHGIRSLTFAPDGRTVAASTGEYDIKLWDVRSRQLLRRLQKDQKDGPNAWWAAVGLAFAPDGRLLASVDTKSPVIRLWDISTGKQVRQLTLSDAKIRKNNWYSPDDVAFSPDGRLLAASGRTALEGSWVMIWEAATGKELPHLTRAINDLAQKDDSPHSPDASRKFMAPQVVFSPNGRMLVKNVRSKVIPIWETATGRQRLVLKDHDESPVCFAFTPDGRTLASASWDETIRLWDLDTGRELRKLIGHRGKANSLAFSADGKVLVSSGDDTTILFWNIADITGRQRPQTAPLVAQEWQALWEDLAKDDAVKAYQVMVRMAAGGSTTIAALKERLHPVRPADPGQLARLLKDLDSDEFAVRELASRELEKRGDVVRPTVQQTLARPGLSLELRRRLEFISSSLVEISGERLRQLRAIEVLEMLGTAEARELLKALAGGAPEALATTAAEVALKRLQR